MKATPQLVHPATDQQQAQEGSVTLKLFLIAVLLHFIPIWIYGYFATQDGPSHLHNAAVMANYFTESSPIFQKYYEVRPNFAGNIISQMVLIGLHSVVPSWLSDKLFLSGYVLLLSMGFWYAVKSVRPDAGLLAFLIFPFVFSSWIHLGFYNFCSGMAVFLFVVGYFIRHQGDFGIKRTATLALLFLLVYACHITAFGAAGLVVAILSFASSVSDWQRQGKRDVRFLLEIGRKHFLPLVAVLPTTTLALLYLGHSDGARFTFDGLRMSAWRIYSVAPIASTSDAEFIFGKALAGLVAVVSGAAVYLRWKDRRLRPNDGLFIAAAAFLLLSFFGPDTVGNDGVYIRLRMVFYFYFALILWIASQGISRRLQKLVAPAAIGISILLFVSRAPVYAELDRQIREYVSAGPFIEPNSTLISLSYASHGFHPTQRGLVRVYLPFENIAGLLAADKPVIDLSNYEAVTYSFWTNFRPNVDPYKFIDGDKRSDYRASAANLLGYPPESGGTVDYVMIWGLDDARRQSNPPERLRDQLIQSYDLIYTSPDRHLVQLYRRKDYVGHLPEHAAAH